LRSSRRCRKRRVHQPPLVDRLWQAIQERRSFRKSGSSPVTGSSCATIRPASSKTWASFLKERNARTGFLAMPALLFISLISGRSCKKILHGSPPHWFPMACCGSAGPRKPADAQPEDIVRRVGLECGLVDVKVCAIDETWSGLKFVIRVKDRK
jgi:hypothetical protein